MEFTLPVSKKVVRMNPMRMKEEKILTNKKFIKNNSTIENLLLSCIDSIDGEKPTERMILDLVAGDRNYLLYHLRIMSYGEIFEFDEVCPHCKQQTHYTIDLEDALANGSIKVTGEPEEGLTKDVVMSDGSVVTVTVMDGNRERRLKEKGDDLSMMDITLSLMKAINGEAVTISAMDNFIGKDLAAIRRAAKDIMCGLLPALTVECEHCDREHEFVVVASQSFFIQ